MIQNNTLFDKITLKSPCVQTRCSERYTYGVISSLFGISLSIPCICFTVYYICSSIHRNSFRFKCNKITLFSFRRVLGKGLYIWTILINNTNLTEWPCFDVFMIQLRRFTGIYIFFLVTVLNNKRDNHSETMI